MRLLRPRRGFVLDNAHTSPNCKPTPRFVGPLDHPVMHPFSAHLFHRVIATGLLVRSLLKANQDLHYVPQAGVQPGSFPRISGLPVHAYLVYRFRFLTHVWSTFAHKWSICCPHHADSEADVFPPVCLYEDPLWTACSSGGHCEKRLDRTQVRSSTPSWGKGACGA